MRGRRYGSQVMGQIGAENHLVIARFEPHDAVSRDNFLGMRKTTFSQQPWSDSTRQKDCNLTMIGRIDDGLSSNIGGNSEVRPRVVFLPKISACG
jgi:hypothetical protein